MVRIISTNLAAFLISQDYKLSEIVYDDDDANFLFPRDNDIAGAVSAFQLSQAEANIVRFIDAKSELVRRIKSRLR